MCLCPPVKGCITLITVVLSHLTGLFKHFWPALFHSDVVSRGCHTNTLVCNILIAYKYDCENVVIQYWSCIYLNILMSQTFSCKTGMPVGCYYWYLCLNPRVFSGVCTHTFPFSLTNMWRLSKWSLVTFLCGLCVFEAHIYAKFDTPINMLHLFFSGMKAQIKI